ncbi:MAG: hypothetical protein ACYC5K_09050 [Saccharofermentanales bacterium]
MIKVRSLRETILYIRSFDADTSISENAIRMLVITGTIPSVKVGKKYLVNVDTVISFFDGKLSGRYGKDSGNEECEDLDRGIRAVTQGLKRQRAV